MTTGIYEVTDTWNDGGTVFTSIKMTITDTAYAAGSYMIDLSSTVAGGYFRVDVDGNFEMSGYLKGFEKVDILDGIIAFAGGGQANATQLLGTYNSVGTVATIGDSIKLPTDVFGTKVRVLNVGANTLDLFPDTGHSIGIEPVDTAIPVAPNGTVSLIGVSATNWRVTT